MPGDLQDLVAWREAAQLAIDVISAARGMRGVGASSAADQLARAAESISANIAEGDGTRRVRALIHGLIKYFEGRK